LHLEVLDWDFVGEKEKGRSQAGGFEKQIANKKPMVWNYNKKQIANKKPMVWNYNKKQIEHLF